MYAPKLLPYTAEERWRMGFDHRIDCRAEEFKAEISRMADEAKQAFEPVAEQKPDPDYAAMLGGYSPLKGALALQQLMNNTYPNIGMYSNAGSAPASNEFWWMGNVFR